MTFDDSVQNVLVNKKSNAMLVFILFSTEENLVSFLCCCFAKVLPSHFAESKDDMWRAVFRSFNKVTQPGKIKTWVVAKCTCSYLFKCQLQIIPCNARLQVHFRSFPERVHRCSTPSLRRVAFLGQEPSQEQHMSLVPINCWSLTGMSTLTRPLQHSSGKGS